MRAYSYLRIHINMHMYVGYVFMQKCAHALLRMPTNKARESGNILGVFCLTRQLLFESQGKE